MCIQEVGEVAAKLIVAVVVIPFDRRVLNRAVHSFDLTVPRENNPPDCFLILGTPWMVRFGQPVFNLICRADHVEAHGPRIGCVPVAGLVCKLDAVVRENSVDLVRNGFQQMFEELSRRLAVCFVDQLRNSELADAINIATNICSLPSAVLTSAMSI